MDNQQERLLASARLAMLIDTEGTISFRFVQREKHRPYSIVPYIQFTNTDVEIVEWGAEALELLKVGRYVQWVNPHGIGKLTQGRVIVLGILRVQDLIPHIKPFLIAKRSNLEAVEEFINSRLSHPNEPYTERELELFDKTRKFKGGSKRQVKSSTTIR